MNAGSGKKPLSDKTYVLYGGAICPFCKSDDIRVDSGIEGCGTEASCIVSCNTCNSRWEELYKMVGFEEFI